MNKITMPPAGRPLITSAEFQERWQRLLDRARLYATSATTEEEYWNRIHSSLTADIMGRPLAEDPPHD